jgi:hypothetical protein
MTEHPMAASERVYYHGRLSLVCALLTVGAVGMSVHVWMPALMIAFLTALHTGYHLGHLVLACRSDSDGSPEGRDASAARSRSDESAGRQASAEQRHHILKGVE